jgi:hypothetical protein
MKDDARNHEREDWVIAVKVSNFSGQYLRNHWTMDIGVLGYIGIVWPKEHSPEVRSFPPGTLCIRRAQDPVPIVQEAGWAPGPVWTVAENLASTGFRSPNRSVLNQSLYRLSYRATFYLTMILIIHSTSDMWFNACGVTVEWRRRG